MIPIMNFAKIISFNLYYLFNHNDKLHLYYFLGLKFCQENNIRKYYLLDIFCLHTCMYVSMSPDYL